jgi:DNA recombination protein Rad52
MMGFSQNQNKALKAKLSATHVRTRVKNGFTLSYVEGWHVIFEANRIFGFDGWDRETVDSSCIWKDNRAGRAACSYMARVRIQVRAGDHLIIREGTGAGHCEANNMGEAHENALKEAETDATKRALSTFGNSFGLALYDKEQRYVRKTPQKSATGIKKGDVVWVVISEGGTLTEYHDDPVAFCAAIRLNLENLSAHDELQLFWEDNAVTIDELRKALPSLQTEGGQHFADVLASIYSARLQAVPDDEETAATPREDYADTEADSLSGGEAVSDTVIPIGTPRRTRDKPHLEFVAAQSCLVCDRKPCHAHHIRFAQPRAMGMKVGDEWAVPLCFTHHRLLHEAGNEAEWWAKHRLNPLKSAERLWRDSRGIQAAE